MEKEIKEKPKYCKICGEQLTEMNRSKDKEGLCIDCESKGDEAMDDHTQQNANQDGTSEEGTL